MYLEILILAHLRQTPAHGYEIKRRVQGTVGGGATLNNNVLYPALRRFEAEGAIEAMDGVEEAAGGPARHVFRLTERGEDRLLDLLEDFPPPLAENDAESMVRVAFLHLLDGRARRRILRTRIDALEGRERHLLDKLSEAAANPAHAHGLAGEVIEFQRQMVRLELDWVRELLAREQD